MYDIATLGKETNMKRPVRLFVTMIVACCLSSVFVFAQDKPKPKAAARSGRGAAIIAFPESETRLSLLADGQSWIDLQFVAWGPNWGWMGLEGNAAEDNGAGLMTTRGKVAGGAELTLTARTAKTGPRQLKVDMELRTSKDTEVTLVVAELVLDAAAFGKGRIAATMADGGTKPIDLPLERKGLGDAVRSFALTDSAGRVTTVSLDPPAKITSEGAARIILAEGRDSGRDAEKIIADAGSSGRRGVLPQRRTDRL